MIDYSFQLLYFKVLKYFTRSDVGKLYRSEALFFTGLTDTISSGPVINQR